MAEASAGADQRVEAGVLPDAFAALDREGWSVLDLGPASPVSVAFFNQLRCRVGFANAQSELAAMARRWPMDGTELRAALQRLLPVEPNRSWRLVLLWDLLDYLPGDLLEAVIQQLEANLAPGARLHGFVTSGPQTVPSEPPAYQILERGVLARAVGADAGRQSPPRYSPWHLQRYMRGAVQESSRQRRDARQEHLFRFSP